MKEKKMIAKKVKCQRCKYIWNTLSNMQYVSCPNCLTKVSIASELPTLKGGNKVA